MNKTMGREAVPQKTTGKIVLKISTKDFIVSVICFVLSRAKLLTYMNPFGMAAYAALFSNTGWFYALLCTGAGIIISKGDYTSLRYILALGVATPVFGLWDKHKKPLFRGLVMSLAYFAVSLLLLMAEGFLLYDFIYFSFEAFICFICVYLIDGIVPLMNNYKSRTSLTAAEMTAIASVTAMAVLACWAVPPLMGMSLASMAAIFIILAVNLEGNCTIGAAVGTVMGLVVSMGSYESASLVGAYAFASFMAGLFKKYSRLGVLLGFTLANAIVTAFLNDTATMLINPIEVLVAGGVFVTLPRKAMKVFTDFSQKAAGVYIPQQQADSGNGAMTAISAQCSTLADALTNLADIYARDGKQKRPGKKYINSLFNQCADNVCSGCGLRFGCWQSVGHNNYQYMLSMLEYAENNGSVDVAHMPKKFAERCVKKEEFVRVFNLIYNIYRADSQWLDKTRRLQRLMSGQLASVSKSVRQLQDNAKLQSDSCMASELSRELDKLGIATDKVYVMQRDNIPALITIELSDGHSGETHRRKELADIISATAGQAFVYNGETADNDGNRTLNFAPAKKYSVRSARCQMQKEGEYVCGDCSAEVYSRGGNYLAVISDGMGSGDEAHSEAQAAVAMLVNLADAGAATEDAVQLINTSLVVRSRKDCFATLDILDADLDTGRVIVSKIGAAPTYIKTSDRVKKLECNSLPAGILSDIQSQSYTLQAEDNMLIVMISDGISNTAIRNLNETDWVYSRLCGINTANPDAVANDILCEAISRCGGKCSDDMTVVVAYIYRNE